MVWLMAACETPGGEPGDSGAVSGTSATEGCAAEPEFVDLTGAWTAEQVDELWTAWEEWTGAAGEGRVCVERVEVDRVPQGVSLDHSAGVVVRIDLTVTYPWLAMYQALCRELDLREELSARLDGLQDVDGVDAYADECEAGPADYVWVERAATACGEPELTPAQLLMYEVVFPLARARIDGSLETIEEEALRVPGVLAGGFRLDGAVRDGDALALAMTADWHGRVVRVDPATGDPTLLLEVDIDKMGDSLSGGPGGAVVVTGAHPIDARWLTRLDDGTGFVVPSTVPWSGVVAEGWYYAWNGASVVAVDLSNGFSTSIAAPPDSSIGTLRELPSGFLAEDEDGTLYRYDPAADRYETLPTKVDDLETVVSLADDLLGAVGGRDLPSGPVLVAFELSTERLLVSDDICAPDALSFSTPGRMWKAESDGDDVVLTAFRFE